MEKNILLLFLSDVKTKDVDGKIVISDVRYENVAGENTQTTNESAVRYLLERFPLDKIFIFASKKVRSEIKGYVGEDGAVKTHLNFFLERVKKFLTEGEPFVYDYDEDADDDKNLKTIAEMAKNIQQFADGEKVTLHVDLTGGMRHVNMMMLELTRLLEYSGLTVGKVLYSNFHARKVEEIQNVYDLFQLIAGVEEFINFGSVHALEKYYRGKELSHPLQKLLDAMHDFAEAIKLCHYGQFGDTIVKLHDSISDFKRQASDDTEDILMARLIGRIHDNYHDLVAIREKDDIRVIRWCVENDYLQQALTLYTERIPEHLGLKGLITQRRDEYRKLVDACGKDVRSPNFYLLNVYKTETKDDKSKAETAHFQSLGNTVGNAISKMQDKYIALIKGIPAALKENLSFGEWYAQVERLIEKICANIKLLASSAPIDKTNIVCADVEKLRAQYELLARVAQNQFDDLSPEELKPLKIFFDKLKPQLETQPPAKKRKTILNALMQMKIDDAKKYFPPLVCRRNVQIFRLKMMIDAQIFDLHFDEEIFFSIMEKYFRLKVERNHSNHAHEGSGEFKTADELRQFMRDALAEIERILPAQ